MGAWSTSITGNDVAADLAYEYRVAFLRFTPDDAVARLDDYVEKHFGGPLDACWPDYVYSLALFMWKHGILTETIKKRALALIENEAGLDLYDASQVKNREKVLEKLSAQLDAPQTAAKQIRLRWNTKPVFHIGDVLALQLHTEETAYFPHERLSESQLRAYDGYWIMIRKIKDNTACRSAIDPSVQDIWPVFDLYNYLVAEIPTFRDLARCRVVKRFFSNGNVRPYAKHNATTITNDMTGITENEPDTFKGIFFDHGDEGILLEILDQTEDVGEAVRENIAAMVAKFSSYKNDD